MSVTTIVIFIVFSLIHLYAYYNLNKKNRNLEKKSALISFVFILVVLIAVRSAVIIITDFVFIITMISLTAHNYLGYVVDLYKSSRTFDRYLHVFGSFSFALFFFSIISSLLITSESRFYNSMFVFTLGMTLGVINEIVEFSIDQKKGTNTQKGHKDTNIDLICNAIGSFVAACISYIFLI